MRCRAMLVSNVASAVCSYFRCEPGFGVRVVPEPELGKELRMQLMLRSSVAGMVAHVEDVQHKCPWVL